MKDARPSFRRNRPGWRRDLRAVGFENIDVVAPAHAELDLKDLTAIGRAVGAGPWDIVINAAAYTDVDRAESEVDLAFAINAEAASRLAVETGNRGIPLIHISTDYVFDGCKGKPYVEHDKIGPLNTYGRSKAAGEHGVRVANPRHIILRTSWVYSHRRKNFVKTVLQLAAKRDQLKIVADQRGCPTPARDVAETCLAIAKHCMSDPEHAPYGNFHFAGAGEASWFEFATAIIGLGRETASQIAKTSADPYARLSDASNSSSRYKVRLRCDCAEILYFTAAMASCARRYD